MFGIKSKPKRPNPIYIKILNDVERDMAKDNNTVRTPLEVESYYYADGRKNFSVTQDYLQALPEDWRRHWMYLDWNLVFPPESEIIEEEIEELEPVDIFTLNPEKKELE